MKIYCEINTENINILLMFEEYSAIFPHMREKNKTKKAAPEDWHRADIVAELHKAEWSLRKLSIHHGYNCPTVLATALKRPWPKGEKLIAEAIGVSPEEIWPSRYSKKIKSAKKSAAK